MKISAIVLVGGNEPYLKYCIKSIESIVDEIIFVMPINTQNIGFTLKGYKVITQDTEETNFAVWRNQALKKCKGDFILRLDADEILANNDGSPVKREQLEDLCKQIETEKLAAIDLFTYHFIYNYFTVDGRDNGFHFTKSALFRKQDAKGYKNPIHEYLEFKDDVPGVAKTIIGPSIWHFGHCKGMEAIREKYRRSMEMPENPFRKEYERLECKDVDDYCRQHNIFKGTLPLIRYDGSLPKVLGLW